MHKYLETLNKEKKEATIRLFGDIGNEIDGNIFAQELASLDNKVDSVNIRINSGGGSVIHGLSIVSTMLSMKAQVNVYIDGIAASMAAVIAVCGDKVYMMDYAKFMIHDPFIEAAPSKLSEKDKKGLEKITEMLRTILSRRGNKEVDIAQLMAKETWFSAEEAKAEGLIDEIVSSKRKDELSSLDAAAIKKIILNEYKPNQNKMELKELAKKLGLDENSDLATIMAALDKLVVAAANATQLIKSHFTAQGLKNGVITEKNKVSFDKLADSDPELFISLVTEKGEEPEDTEIRVVAGSQRLSGAIKSVQGIPSATSTKTYDWYQRNDPQALLKLERDNPKEYEKLLNAYENGI
jgi:ATP-dependent Clp endopeptidase proteolytic subunit ClpP